MFKSLLNAFKVKELRKKLLYTFLMLVVIRIGSQLPIPGVKTTFFAELFAKQNNDAFGFFNTITGGSFTNMSVFALSITPYITSSIIMQLLTIANPTIASKYGLQRDAKFEEVSLLAKKIIEKMPVEELSEELENSEAVLENNIAEEMVK